jgi:hypothetical protein
MRLVGSRLCEGSSDFTADVPRGKKGEGFGQWTRTPW